MRNPRSVKNVRDLELHIVTHTRAILIGIVEGIHSGLMNIFVQNHSHANRNGASE